MPLFQEREREIARLQGENQTFRITLEQDVKKINDLSDKNAIAQRTVAKLELDQQTYLAQKDSYLREYESLKKEADRSKTLADQAHENDKRISQLQSDNAALIEKYKRANGSYHDMLTTAEDLRNKLTNVQREVESSLRERENASLIVTSPDQDKVPSPHGRLQAANTPYLAADGGNFTAESPDDFTIAITRAESGDNKGLMLMIQNRRLDSIGSCGIAVHSAQSYDARLRDYSKNRKFQALDYRTADIIDSRCAGFRFWLVRKNSGSTPLYIGTNGASSLHWSEIDPEPVHRWLITFTISSSTVPDDEGTPPSALVPIDVNLVIVRDLRKNEFSMELTHSF